ncbi:MAG: hypothetical protein ACFCVC_05830 [Acidimicrobiia bacterium]
MAYPAEQAKIGVMTDAATRALLAAQDGDPAGFERFVQLTLLDVTRYCR